MPENTISLALPEEQWRIVFEVLSNGEVIIEKQMMRNEFESIISYLQDKFVLQTKEQ